MAVKIRLKRMGMKGEPFYRVVVADSRTPRDGRFVEEIGTYNPVKGDDCITLNVERAKYWVSVGAQPTQTVKSILRKGGAIEK